MSEASTELFEALEQHDLDAVAAALRAGADPNATMTSPPGWRLLHAAIEELEFGGSPEALALLLRSGADPNGWDSAMEASPLLMAVFRNSDEAVRLLLAAGADPNVVGAEGDSPLRWVVEHSRCDLAATLLRAGATATVDDAGGPSGMTALGRAAHELDLPLVDVLLRHGADPQARDADRLTALERLPRGGDGPADVRAAIEAKLLRE